MASQYVPPIRTDLVGVEPYGAPQLDVPYLLNVNENPYPPSVAMVEAVAEAVAIATSNLNRYPDREFHNLRAALGEYLGNESGVKIAAERIWAANGSNEVMHQILLAFGGPGRTVLSFAPTYSMYPEYARDTFTRYVTVERDAHFHINVDDAIHAIDIEKPSVILITSPNNPTGTAIDLETIERITAAASGIVVVDEAYAEFRRPQTPSALELLARWPNLIVSRTMSKAFACAGLRLGYVAAANPEVINALRIVRLPYHLSAVTQAVALTALNFADELQENLQLLRDGRDDLELWLRERGLTVAESDANFVFFGTFDDRHAVWQGLLDHGVLIRQTGPEGWLRVSVGTPDENAAFKRALDTVLS